MFFQELEHDKQVDCMYALFDRLNESLFGNCLTEGPFDEICIGVGGYEENIANLFTHGDTEYHNERDFVAIYISFERLSNIPGFEKVQGIIVIRQATVDELITKEPTEELQIKMLASLLLHEMTHLFCDKRGIYDGNHNKAWKKVARDHGLIPAPAGELDSLAPKAAQAIKDLKFFSDLLTEEGGSMNRVGIVLSYQDKEGRNPWPLKAVSKNYKIRDVIRLLQKAEEQGEENIHFTISQAGLFGVVIDEENYTLTEPLPEKYETGITAEDINIGRR